MALKKVSEKKWAYTLYAADKDYILSVVCGDVAIYELNIPLSSTEAANALADSEYLDRLATEIAHAPDKFAPRSIKI